MTALAGVYALGVIAGLVFTDARWPARVVLALLWPLGPLTFIIVIAILFLASLIAFPIFGAVVLAGLLGAAAVFAQAPDGSPDGGLEGLPYIEARFIGNMAYAISDGSATLFTDFPYKSGYSIYMEYDPCEIRSSTQAALSLITHRHGDHWDRSLFEKTNWRVIGPRDAVEGVNPSRIVLTLPVAPIRSRVTVDRMTIDALPSPHAGIAGVESTPAGL